MQRDFMECDNCRAKPGSPTLCQGCLHNRRVMNNLREEIKGLETVYGVAMQQRTFPVPFEDHWELVGAVDDFRNKRAAKEADDDPR